MQSTRSNDARTELISRLERGAWAEEKLVATILDETNVDRDELEATIADLRKRGEVYTFNGVLKRS